ncbi:LysR family transcriptional regulator [Streptomyces actuosus]|uniref:LysR family transcriptional regulator n=1 Tax=Streptomyces actuosus TaxID=1885 RepID=A0ABS2VZD1_STRAS|nr:LysR family transcriptional regulator [Streptomyces actuosus]MBN0048507.1 LysR family transcriptional regulator [Streptomyces actuosus]
MEWSSTALRVLRAVAETGSFTAAAAAVGYTQSAVSRQVAVLEQATGVPLFERQPSGVRLTAAGATFLRHASTALDEVDQAARLLHEPAPNRPTLRLGAFTSIGAALVPEALALLRQRRPGIDVFTREAYTPALTRSLRAGTIDLAVISARPPYPSPDDQNPPLDLDVLVEGDLMVAVPAAGAIGRDGTATLAELQDAEWIAGPDRAGEPGIGVWPTLPRQPVVRHRPRDWVSKLHLVATGCGVTTVPPSLIGLLPEGVRLVRVVDGARVTRRVLLARLPGAPAADVLELARCLHEAAERLPLA